MESDKYDIGLKEFDEGEYFYSRGQEKQARDKIILSAQKGYANAQFTLATFYYSGECGMSKDIYECEKWAKKAADQNFADACKFLGNIYLNNKLPLYNLDHAVNYYKKAIALGNYEGAGNLGLIYLMDEYPGKNYTPAQHYFDIAINHGFPSGYFGMGVMYEKKNDDENAHKYYELAKMKGYESKALDDALLRVYPLGFWIEHFKGAGARLVIAIIASLIILLLYNTLVK